MIEIHMDPRDGKDQSALTLALCESDSKNESAKGCFSDEDWGKAGISITKNLVCTVYLFSGSFRV
jgi:hypothetical protein